MFTNRHSKTKSSEALQKAKIAVDVYVVFLGLGQLMILNPYCAFTTEKQQADLS